jgi:hypothetical protein
MVLSFNQDCHFGWNFRFVSQCADASRIEGNSIRFLLVQRWVDSFT